MASLQCHHCGTPLTLDEPIGREATCEKCGHDLRACVQCRDYDTRFNNSCREPDAEPVLDKQSRNFCEFFYFSREPFVAGAPAKDRASEARAKLDSLFKPAPGMPVSKTDRVTDARARFEALFKKPKPEE